MKLGLILSKGVLFVNSLIEIDIKTQKLDYIANEIHDYAKLIRLTEGYLYRKAEIGQDTSLFLNFRDGLIHYIKLYEVNEKVSFDEQYYAILDHLSRGIKDSFLHFIQEINIKISNFIESDIYLLYSNKDKNIIRTIVHKLKSVSLSLRIKGISLERAFDNSKVIFGELLSAIQELEKFLKSKGLHQRFFITY
jgi:hypothetical protein